MPFAEDHHMIFRSRDDFSIETSIPVYSAERSSPSTDHVSDAKISRFSVRFGVLSSDRGKPCGPGVLVSLLLLCSVAEAQMVANQDAGSTATADLATTFLSHPSA